MPTTHLLFALCVLLSGLLIFVILVGNHMWRQAQADIRELVDRLMSRNYSEFVNSRVVQQREPRKFKVLSDEEMAQREALAKQEADRG